MILQKKPAELRLQKPEFDKFLYELKGRGFVDSQAERGMMMGPQTAAMLKREIAGFELIVGGSLFLSEEFIKGRVPDMSLCPVDLWAKFRFSGRAGLSILTTAFEKKSHFISYGSSKCVYDASLVPCADGGELIGNAMALGEVVDRTNNDREFTYALDAKAASESLERGIKEISSENVYLGHVNKHTEAILTYLRGKYEFELARMRADESAAKAMGAVADK